MLIGHAPHHCLLPGLVDYLAAQLLCHHVLQSIEQILGRGNTTSVLPD
jgi:hypothetical protein